MVSSRNSILLILFGVTGLLSSCSKPKVDGRPPTVAVQGIVMMDQTPVEGATVVFIPLSHNFAAAGTTDVNGRFQLRTFEENDGAVEGSYQVTVKKFYFADNVEYQSLPIRYSKGTQSGLTAEVRSDLSNQFEFRLTK